MCMTNKMLASTAGQSKFDAELLKMAAKPRSELTSSVANYLDGYLKGLSKPEEKIEDEVTVL